MAGSKRIAGITIEFDGEFNKLNDGLKNVDKQLSETKSALRDVDRLLKFNPKNTELLRQKQKLLGDAIGQTKDRLSQLKSAQSQVTDPKQYDALQREIIATEGYLEHLEAQYRDLNSTGTSTTKSLADSLKTVGDKIKNAGTKVKEVGGKISAAGKAIMPVSAGVAAVGAAAVKSAQDLDKGYDIIIKKTGATGKAAEGLKEQMDNVFTSVPTDAETAGNAIGEVNTRFGATGTELASLSEEFVKFAEITDSDVTSAVANVDKVMEKFGIDSKDADKVMGLLAKTGQDTGVSMESLYQQLEKNGSTLKGMNLSLPESVNLLGQFEASGVDSSKAMAALKKAQTNAAKAGKPLSKTLKDTVKQIKNAKTDTEALNIATQTFGTKGAAEMTQAIREGKINLDNLSGSLNDYKDTVNSTYEATLDPWDKMTVAVNNLKVAGNELAEELFNELVPIMDEVVGAVKNFTKWFKGLDDGQKQLIVRIGLVVAAAGPLLIAIGSIVTAIGTIIEGIGGAISIIGSLVGVLSSAGSAIVAAAGALGPVGLAVAAVAAACVAAGVLIYKNWDKIKKWASDLAKNLKKKFNEIKKTLSNTWKNITNTVTTALNNTKKLISTGWNAVKSTTVKTWTNIRTAVTNALNTVRSGVTSGMNRIKNAMGTAWSGIRSVTTTVWGNIRSTVSGAIEKVRSVTSSGLSKVRSTATTAFNSVKSVASSAWSSIYSTISSKVSSIRYGVTNAFSTIRSSVSNTFRNVYSAITSPLSRALSAVRTVVSRIKSAFKFTISLPKIRLPHIDVRWLSVGKYFKIPRLSLRWYRKAYENPMMFTSPTVLQTPYGAKGFGDGNGGEIVYGHDNLMRDIRQAVGAGRDIIINVYGAQGQNVNQLADAVSRRLNKTLKQQEAAFG